MGKKILLADDSITIQKVIELTFSDEDFEVVTVGNGRLAVERVQDVRPDIVLCDIIMPEKDGYEVCDFIKKHPQLSHVPVLLLTGAFEPFDQERAARVGCDGFLAKPFEPRDADRQGEGPAAAGRLAGAAAARSPGRGWRFTSPPRRPHRLRGPHAAPARCRRPASGSSAAARGAAARDDRPDVSRHRRRRLCRCRLRRPVDHGGGRSALHSGRAVRRSRERRLWSALGAGRQRRPGRAGARPRADASALPPEPEVYSVPTSWRRSPTSCSR